jgi:hypothetical protein
MGWPRGRRGGCWKGCTRIDEAGGGDRACRAGGRWRACWPAQAAVIAASQRATCTALLDTYPDVAFFYARDAGVVARAGSLAGAAVLGGAACDLALAVAASPPAAAAAGCAVISCRQAMFMLYLGVAALTWAAAPSPAG